MKFLIFVVNLIFLILKGIGDFILFYVELAGKTAKKTASFLKKFYKNINSYKTARQNWLKREKELFNFRSLLFLKRLRRKFLGKKRLSKQNKKQNLIAIYPAPKHFRIKAKYFVFGFLFCFIFIFIPFSIYAFLNSLPNPKELSEREIPQTTKIYDRNGALLYQIYANENRTLVPLASIPKNLINATIAIEDKDFYKNPGFDINAIIRAMLSNISGKPIQGGSTITQQLVKSTLLTPEVSIKRKIKEVILAFWAERIYSKNQVLEMYFNQVPYGGTAWGIEAASETYFGKSVKDLDLAESAFLAGMPQAPTTYSPYGQNPDLWKDRQKQVLDKMLALKYITKEDHEIALSENLSFILPQTPIYAPHFVLYVKDLLIKKYGLPFVEKGGLSVTTSLDLSLHNRVQDIVTNEVNNNYYLNLTNGAALVTNPKNGDILAMVGSKDYNDPNGGNVNLTTSLRQPGSSIKVVTYTAALSNGFTAATILEDTPVTYKIAGSEPYTPVNYDGGYHGRIPLRIALGNSFNIPAVKTLNKIGISTMVNYAKKMGITTWKEPQDYGLSLTLGAAEVKMVDLATVYGTVANLGKKVTLDPILKITDYQQKILYQKQEELPMQVIDPGVAFIISNILSDNNARSLEFGPNSPLLIPGHTVSVKTGTTDNKRDNWTIGFTPNHLVAVWVGNNDNTPMSQALASGITGAAPIWHSIMNSLLSNVNSLGQKIPDNVVSKNCYGIKEYFIKGNDSCPTATASASFVKKN